MEIIIGGRRYGKTAKALEWVKQATPTDTYPFWDRVLLTVNMQEADRLRSVLRGWARSQGWTTELVGLTYNMVYYVEEWRRVQIGQQPIDVMIDNADMFLQGMFRGTVRGVTWTVRPQPEDAVMLLDDQGGSIGL